MDIVQRLKYTEEKYGNFAADFGELKINVLAFDCRTEIEKLREENKALQEENKGLRAFKARFDGLYRQGIGLSDSNFSSATLDETGLG